MPAQPAGIHLSRLAVRIGQKPGRPVVELAQAAVDRQPRKRHHLHHLVGREQILLGQHQRPLREQIVGADLDPAPGGRLDHQLDHHRTAQPQPVRRGDDQIVDVVPGIDVVHRQRARDRHHAHERQARDRQAVAHRLLPHLGRGQRAPPPGLNDPLAPRQRKILLALGQALGHQAAVAQHRLDRRQRRCQAHQEAVHLTGGQRVVEHVGIRHRVQHSHFDSLGSGIEP